MANLAIKGHATRGKEVIELLEMFGGKNVTNYDGSNTKSFYFLNNIIICSGYVSGKLLGIYCCTLEEFLEKFPYKVGDKAFAFGNKCTIIDAVWDEGIDEVVYTIKLNTSKYTTTKLSNQLQPYKEETMEETIKIDIPKGYEFAGVDAQQAVFEKIGHQYPKTYEECCEVLGIDVSRTIGHSEDLPFYIDVTCYEYNLLSSLAVLRKLLICRDAYWKIAGEQMGLEKPWSPSKNDDVYCIFRLKGKIVKDNFVFGDSLILEFPTEEIRSAFYENFKELIEQCRELL